MTSDHVFLSHSSKNKTWTEALARNLVENGVAVFFDTWHISGGDRFVLSLEDATARSRAAVIVLTPDATESNWVRDEYDSFKRRHNTPGSSFRIVPVLLEPKSTKFGFLKNLQHVDFTDADRYATALGELIAALRGDPPGSDPQPATVVDNPYARHSSAAATAVDLLAPPSTFTGRDEDVDHALKAMNSASLMLHGLQGMGGIGKTALAREVATHLEGTFSRRCEINLRGVSGDGAGPVSPEAAMRAILVWYAPHQRLPDDTAQLSQLYQHTLANAPILLLLDNAAHAGQVEPLLPRSGSAAIVTTRKKFSMTRVGVEFREVGLLDEADAIALAQKHCKALTDAQAKTLAVELCASLPLAIEIAASGLAIQLDAFTVDEVFADLRQRRLKTFADLKAAAEGDVDAQSTPVALNTSIGWSYDALPDDASRERFLEISVFPCDFDAVAAAAEWNEELDDDVVHIAKTSLGMLRRAGLLLEDENGTSTNGSHRFVMHDLVHDWARQRLATTNGERRTIQRRFIRHFTQLLAFANHLYLEGKPVEGLRFYDHESANIGAAFEFAKVDADHVSVIAIANTGALVMDLRQSRQQRIEWMSVQRDAARAIGDRQAEGGSTGKPRTCPR
ncbi:MAG: toll/interleukin-1 receptor domain-containing protein [Planctomycetota bacterium]